MVTGASTSATAASPTASSPSRAGSPNSTRCARFNELWTCACNTEHAGDDKRHCAAVRLHGVVGERRVCRCVPDRVDAWKRGGQGGRNDLGCERRAFWYWPMRHNVRQRPGRRKMGRHVGQAAALKALETGEGWAKYGGDESQEPGHVQICARETRGVGTRTKKVEQRTGRDERSGQSTGNWSRGLAEKGVGNKELAGQIGSK
eukprot:6173350-Pleurochrysis_carterae.AAC.2